MIQGPWPKQLVVATRLPSRTPRRNCAGVCQKVTLASGGVLARDSGEVGTSVIEVGTEQIYRLAEFAASERVKVVAIDQRKKTPRYEVEFLDGEKAGTVENVPAVRLRGCWSTVEIHDERVAHWQRFLDEEPCDSVKDGAVEHVFREVVAGSTACMAVWVCRR